MKRRKRLIENRPIGEGLIEKCNLGEASKDSQKLAKQRDRTHRHIWVIKGKGE